MRVDVTEILSAGRRAFSEVRSWGLFARSGALPRRYEIVTVESGVALLSDPRWSEHTLRLRNGLSRRLVDHAIDAKVPFEVSDSWTGLAETLRPMVRSLIAESLAQHRAGEPGAQQVSASVSWILLHYVIEDAYGVNFGDDASFRGLVAVCAAGYVPCALFRDDGGLKRVPRIAQRVAF